MEGINTEIISFIIKAINKLWGVISSLYEYREIYKITGIFATRRFRKAQNLHKYAVLVAARNEEAVIGNLVDSIRKQDYPAELVDIFVVADNCTDNTAAAARELGAVCYERNDTEHRTKGYALQYLVECIRKDYGIEAYEGYFIFDADNLLKRDYISRMNESFDEGQKIITSYRNTKNFDDNWISASYALHWLRTIRNEHRARSLFHLATRIQGTGFLFANELIKNGWNYTSLTEDRAFCADAVANGYQITYNHEAVFYDEQPVDIKIAMRQRIRWAKGHLQALAETGPKLLFHIFYTGGMANKRAEEQGENPTKLKRFINNIRLRFMSFDMLTVVFPRLLGTVIKKFLVYSLRIVMVLCSSAVFTINLAPKFVRVILNFFEINAIPQTKGVMVLWLIFCALAYTASSYFSGIITAVYIFIIERVHIPPMKWYKKLWFCLTFPIFDLMGKLSMVIALFIKVEWKPIPHNASINIDEIKSE